MQGSHWLIRTELSELSQALKCFHHLNPQNDFNVSVIFLSCDYSSLKGLYVNQQCCDNVIWPYKEADQ